MAFRTIFRRFQICRAHPAIFFSQILNSSGSQHQILSFPRTHLPYNLTEAFHRTCIIHCKLSHYFSTFQHSESQYILQTIDFDECINEIHVNIPLGLPEFLETVQKAKNYAYADEAMAFLDNSGVKPSKDLIFSAIWALREEWKLAFLVFKWGENWKCVVEKTRCLMIWLLGNHQKFSTAWTLIHDLYKASMDTQQAMFVMIDRYAAANNPSKAIETFKILQKFKFSPDQRTFFSFLDILCKHGNIEEAEESLFLNKKFFPLETESFNIILNGWCNIAIDIYEAKRVWREMSRCCILPDETSYTHMISCFSRVSNLFDSLRLYDEMKKKGWIPVMKVYNSLIYVLTRENCLNEALRIVDNMKQSGMQPDSTTYNSMIRPLWESAKFGEARTILAMMIRDDVNTTGDTYHAFLEGANLERTFEVLNLMRKSGLGPSRHTFLLTLRKFLKIGQPENALKIWSNMKQYEVVPDSEHYSVLVEGLVKCKLFVEGRELYAEMRSNGLVDDPKLKKLLSDPVRDGIHALEGQGQTTVVRCIQKGKGLRHGKGSAIQTRRPDKQSEKKGSDGT
ncbi:Pentatricopeptide repeat-containing protein [Forsythia ovata]|uniref:Pentatricopeptide repeat-containing protein n=1 Tax=Forsythia ovata TaxID=205694 RepID=A0ABD1PFW0_9LAMI